MVAVGMRELGNQGMRCCCFAAGNGVWKRNGELTFDLLREGGCLLSVPSGLYTKMWAAQRGMDLVNRARTPNTILMQPKKSRASCSSGAAVQIAASFLGMPAKLQEVKTLPVWK